MVALLGRHTAQARQVLRRLLVDKIEMEPVIDAGRRGYRVSGRLTIGRLLQGEAVQLVQAGGEPSFGGGSISESAAQPKRYLG
jgi:hypothetical protein